jgi:putative addiction module CopG family antidote
MPTRNVNLTDELDRFVAAKVKTGRYENASEVIRSLSALWNVTSLSTGRSQLHSGQPSIEATRAASPRATSLPG